MKTKGLLLLGIIILTLGMTGCINYKSCHSVELRTPMTEGMNFSLTSDNSITVVGAEGYKDCYLRAFLSATGSTWDEARHIIKKVKMELVRDGDNYTVVVTKPKNWNENKNRLSIRYAVIMPPRANIDILSTHGDIEIINMGGAFRIIAPRGEAFCMGCGYGTMQDKNSSLSASGSSVSAASGN